MQQKIFKAKGKGANHKGKSGLREDEKRRPPGEIRKVREGWGFRTMALTAHVFWIPQPTGGRGKGY